ncbi:hypothetical protein F4821DRAFT_264009 [Hypoxylon rubiginosum]|uniref:Uncharacterized protein n=1 Tax=Hypoxylon rubiginosum TaxID=110542 RepID=A0ACC0CPL8_9PEZI|nr:hypothetical protein F4821DRAFT_264009 [Hypoxylon rubiginosum]
MSAVSLLTLDDAEFTIHIKIDRNYDWSYKNHLVSGREEFCRDTNHWHFRKLMLPLSDTYSHDCFDWNFDDDEFDGHEEEREVIAMQNKLEASRNSILNAAARLDAIVTDMCQTKDDLAQIRANLDQRRAELEKQRAELEQKHANLQEVAGILGTTVDGLVSTSFRS